MPRTLDTLLALATLSVSASVFAQVGAPFAYSADPGNSGSSYTGSSYTQPAAPIERSEARADTRSYAQPDARYDQQAPSQGYNQPQRSNQTTQPVQGVWVIAAPDASVQTVSATPDHTELLLEHGRANVNIHHPADHSEILVDLPRGQVSLLKDGLYTFNTETNTVRVLRGEAEVSMGAGKPVKVKEEHQLVFGANGAQPRAQEADHNQLRADLLQGNYGQGGGDRHGDGYGYREGFYGYPYAGYAYGWPYYGFGYGPGWGSPYYAFGYPYGYGFGLGFGYYGGFRGGYGYRGGYGGFRGGYGGYRGGFRR